MDRYTELTLVLQFDSQYERVFTAFERMYIQKERVECMRESYQWKIPLELDDKVQNVLHRMAQIKWQPYTEI